MIKMISKSFFRNLSVTGWLIIINAVASILSIILWSIYPNFIDYVALKPISIIHGKYLWTLVTHMFVHGGFFHLFINMFVLFSLGGLCERIIGRKRFLWFYLSAGLFAGLLSVFFAGFFGFGSFEKVFGRN